MHVARGRTRVERGELMHALNGPRTQLLPGVFGAVRKKSEGEEEDGARKRKRKRRRRAERLHRSPFFFFSFRSCSPSNDTDVRPVSVERKRRRFSHFACLSASNLRGEGGAAGERAAAAGGGCV